MTSPHWLPSSEAEGTIAGPFGQKIVISRGGPSPNFI